MSRGKSNFKQFKDATPSISHAEAENMKRIHLLFDRISSLLLSERTLQGIPLDVLRAAKDKAKHGDYFIKSSIKGYETVDWASLERDVRAGFISVAPGMTDEEVFTALHSFYSHN